MSFCNRSENNAVRISLVFNTKTMLSSIRLLERRKSTKTTKCANSYPDFWVEAGPYLGGYGFNPQKNVEKKIC